MAVARRYSFRVGVLGAWLAALALTGCAQSENLEYDAPPATKTVHRSDSSAATGSIFGSEGLSLFGGDKKSGGEPTAPIPVNSFLWRATLDTLSFMPLASADPFGGVIITDWFTPSESTNERFKMTVYILSRDLRADGLRVAVFRQRADGAGNWIDSKVGPETASELENTILTRARELRVASVE